jgi:lysyl-tRNA synthetase class 1
MFLDENGEKISKSRGNGIAVEEWLKYAPQESLAFYMYQKPKAAKRLYFDVSEECRQLHRGNGAVSGARR